MIESARKIRGESDRDTALAGGTVFRVRPSVRGIRAMIKSLLAHLGLISFREARWLEKRHVQNCRVVQTRTALLEECLPKEGIVAEVGTQYGHFAKEILHTTRPKELHLIDLSFDLLETAHFADAINGGQVRLHQSDSVHALTQFPDHYFDWIYIDGDHTYQGVKRDIAVSTRKVKPDGFLAFNDYTYWSPVELMEYGVVHAVNELCIDGGYEILFFVFNNLMYCDVVLRKIGHISARQSL